MDVIRFPVKVRGLKSSSTLVTLRKSGFSKLLAVAILLTGGCNHLWSQLTCSNVTAVLTADQSSESIFPGIQKPTEAKFLTPASGRHGFFHPTDTFNRKRFRALAIGSAVTYSAVVIALNEIWYKDFPRNSFHFFNDWGEWMQIDKYGHLMTTYFESYWSYSMIRWSGVPEETAVWAGALGGILMQTTIEVLDGFSAEWGFSMGDMAMNVAGAAAFYAQQKAWREQRIHFKMSSTYREYPATPIASTNGEAYMTLEERADDLFGTGRSERTLKDYNAQTIWASVNLSTFIKNRESPFPKWLQLAVGISAHNMFGGFGNNWTDDDGNAYVLSAQEYPRFQQFYLSPDVDLSRIPSKSPFVRTLLNMLNIFKFPAPAVEYNVEHGLRWHWLHY